MVEVQALKKEQIKLARKVLTTDQFDEIKTIAGVDQAFAGEEVISAIIVCDYESMEVIEEKSAVVKAIIPYIPGFLSYRESPAAVEAFSKLEKRPDMLIVEANGILHPRRLGMASHLGILLDQATIGVAKNRLCGEEKDSRIYVDKELRGYSFVSREHAKPIYVSPGHKVSPQTSLEIIKKCMRYPHKMPEPLHLARKLSTKLRKEREP